MLLTFIFFLFMNSGFSQPIGNTWYYSYSNVASNGFVKFEITGDTLIGLDTYIVIEKMRKVYAWPGFYDSTSLGQEYLCWENDTVYRLINEQKTLLFTFNSNIGDTISFRIAESLSPSCDSIGLAVVDSVGTISVQGQTLKWISVTPLLTAEVAISGKIVEGIGPVESYFFPEYYLCIADANEGGFFRCISDSTGVLFNSGVAPSCDYLTSINDIQKLNLQIYPNPTTTQINFTLPDNEDYEITIYNALSSIVILSPVEGRTIDNGQYTINISHLPPGIYFIEARGEKVFRGKFVKE